VFGSKSLCLLAFGLLAVSLVSQTTRMKAVSPKFSQPSSEMIAEVPNRLQPPIRVPISPPGQSGFPQLARSAGIIFSGTVARIERHPARGGQSLETIAITFHIENAIRGAARGKDLTIAQWSGLWSNGQRYRLGERVLLFLYPRSKLGLTSVVAAPMGRFEVDSRNRVVLSARHFPLFQSDPVLGGKSRVSFSDFALVVRQACEEE
jgi:hypothetical protein